MERVLCVRTGNVSRSPMMQAVLQQHLGADFLVEALRADPCALLGADVVSGYCFAGARRAERRSRIISSCCRSSMTTAAMSRTMCSPAGGVP